MIRERGNQGLKLADRYIGIPLVAILGCALAIVRRASNASKCERDGRLAIGILATGGIGCAILASAIMQDIRDAFPDASLTIFTSKANASVASLITAINEAIVLPIMRPWRALAQLRRRRLDWLIDIGAWPRINAVFSGLSGSRNTVGFKTRGQCRHMVYDYVVNHRSDRHQLENLRALVEPLKISPTKHPTIKTESAPPNATPARPFVVFHAWPGGYKSHYKEWPTGHWQDLGQRVQGLGWTTVLTGGRDDIDKSAFLAGEIGNAGVQVTDLAGTCSLAQTAALIQRADAVVSVDTGIMHLAAALGTPIVGLQGPSSSLRWGPVGSRAASVNAPGSGCPYLDLGFEYPSNPPDCMARISTDNVMAALLRIARAPQS